MICYNFRAHIGWYRTSVTIPERGGALVSGSYYELVKHAPCTEAGEMSEEKMWKNYAYFIRNVMPVAEEVGVRMALRPHDPPVSPLRGIGRIFTKASAFARAMDTAPSESNGLAFCQATFRLIGENVEALARRFGEQKRIFFVHLRDVSGTAERFHETSHDNGSTSMPQMLRAHQEVGFQGPIRPDHAPTMEGEGEGEGEGTPGYEMLGRLFAVGYMNGITETLDIPSE